MANNNAAERPSFGGFKEASLRSGGVRILGKWERLCFTQGLMLVLALLHPIVVCYTRRFRE